MEKQEFEGYTGVWRRMKSGAAVFIRDGEDIKTAVRRNFNSKKMESKRKELIDKESDLYRKTNEYRKKTRDTFEEKGELSQEFADAQKMHETYARARENATLDRSAYEYEMDKVETRNKKGIRIKQDEVDTLKQVGNVEKNIADLENSVIRHKNTRAELNKKGMQNADAKLINKDLADEMEMNEFKNKYSRFYGHEAMKDVEARAIDSLDKAEAGKTQTKKFKAETTRKQRAKAIDEANGGDKHYETTKKDLLSYYTEDYGYDGSPEEAFVKQMDAVNYGHDNPYQMGKRIAEGGSYLIYNGDMVEYLSARGIKSNIDNAFDKYTDYIGKQSAKLYEEIKNRKK